MNHILHLVPSCDDDDCIVECNDGQTYSLKMANMVGKLEKKMDMKVVAVQKVRKWWTSLDKPSQLVRTYLLLNVAICDQPRLNEFEMFMAKYMHAVNMKDSPFSPMPKPSGRILESLSFFLNKKLS